MNSKIDPAKKAKPADGSPNDVNVRLSDEELSQVSGGDPKSASSAKLLNACATGQHIKEAKII